MGSVAVTGSSGFIGTRLMSLLHPHAIPLVRDAARCSGNARLMVAADPAALANALRGVDAVVALGGLAHQGRDVSDSEMLTANAELPEALAQAAADANVGTFVYVSSTKVFGLQRAGDVFTDATPRRPTCAYGRSKAEGEDRLMAIAARTGLRVVVLRPPLVYGRGVKGNLALLSRLSKWRIPLPVGAIRSNRRSLVALDSLCQAIVMATEKTIPTGCYIVCDDETLSTRQIVDALCANLRWRPWLLPVPPRALRQAFGMLGKSSYSENLIDSMECNAAHLKNASGWRPAIAANVGLAQLMDKPMP
jgi:nucleoside-diphosphate-sugar epimerase